MDFIKPVEDIIAAINRFVWGPAMIALILGTGLYFSFRTNFIQIRKFKSMINQTILKAFKTKGKKTAPGSISSFQALTTALGGTLGTGNIAGVATAIAIAGPGSIFWMILAATVGMATKYAEIVLAVHYRKRNGKGEWTGGPMAYIERGLKVRWLAIIYAVIGVIASLGMGNMTQSNSIAMAMKDAFNIAPGVTAVILAVVVGLSVSGGVKKIAGVAEIIIPFMSVFYIIGAIIVIIAYFNQLPTAFGLMVKYAFTPLSPVGGFAGATVAIAMQKGISRGVFTNEAGLGSASIAHAAADTDSPAKQGLWGIFEVFFDTVVMCLITALVILVSGVWKSGSTGSSLTISAFESVMPGIGRFIIAVSLAFFAFSSIITWSYYGRKCLEYLSGEKNQRTYIFLYIAVTALGAVLSLNIVWELSDALNGIMAIPNLIGLIGLGKVVSNITKKDSSML